MASPLRHFSGKKTDSRPSLYPGMAERIFNWEEGGGAHKRASEAPTLKAVWGILPQEILKLGNAIFII